MSEFILIEKPNLANIADIIRVKIGITEPLKMGDINTSNKKNVSRVKLIDGESN